MTARPVILLLGFLLATPAVAQDTRPLPAQGDQSTDNEIAKALRRHYYNIAPAAKSLGISRTTLYARALRMPGVLRSADQLTDEEIRQAYDRHQKNIQAMAEDLAVPPKPLRTRLEAALKKRR